MWQDSIFTIGGILFSIAMVPTIYENNKLGRCDIPYKTSVLNLYLYMYCIAFASLGLLNSSISVLLVSITWTIILYQRFKFNDDIVTLSGYLFIFYCKVRYGLFK